MNKIYLVSYIQCWNDQAMEKSFQLFNTKEDAIRYKDELKLFGRLKDEELEKLRTELA